jgi:thioredoxin reductase (NADPH)
MDIMSISIKEINSLEYEKTVLNSDLPVALMFYSDKCHICKNFIHIFDKSKEHNHQRMHFFKMSNTLNSELVRKLNITKSPTVLFFSEGKESCNRLIGNILFTELQDTIEKIIGRECGRDRKEIIRSDVLILGAGPAGLTAGIYTSRSKLYTMIVDTAIAGGQVANTYHIANYPGTNGVVKGIDLVDNMKEQALEFGSNLDEFQNITEVDFSKPEKVVKTSKNEYYARSVIIATGADPRRLSIENESEFRGKGIHYCATCDGAFYQDADLMVVGGGISALEEALFLTRYAKHVTIINKNSFFKAAKLYIDEVLHHPKISVVYNSNVVEVKGDDFVKSVVLKDSEKGEISEMPIDGIFVYIGLLPNTNLFKDSVELSPGGYVKIDHNFMTNVPGVFAAGDVCEKSIRQISTAVGDGTVAAIMAERFLTSEH